MHSQFPAGPRLGAQGFSGGVRQHPRQARASSPAVSAPRFAARPPRSPWAFLRAATLAAGALLASGCAATVSSVATETSPPVAASAPLDCPQVLRDLRAADTSLYPLINQDIHPRLGLSGQGQMSMILDVEPAHVAKINAVLGDACYGVAPGLKTLDIVPEYARILAGISRETLPPEGPVRYLSPVMGLYNAFQHQIEDLDKALAKRREYGGRLGLLSASVAMSQMSLSLNTFLALLDNDPAAVKAVYKTADIGILAAKSETQLLQDAVSHVNRVLSVDMAIIRDYFRAYQTARPKGRPQAAAKAERALWKKIFRQVNAQYPPVHLVADGLAGYILKTLDVAEAGMIPFVAKGNDHLDNFPADIQGVTPDAEVNFLAMTPYVIVVNASEPAGDPASVADDIMAPYNSRGHGSWLRSFTMPGTLLNGTYEGTSFATPLLKGVVALAREADPSLDFFKLDRLLAGIAIDTPAPPEQEGLGHIDPRDLVSAVIAARPAKDWPIVATQHALPSSPHPAEKGS